MENELNKLIEQQNQEYEKQFQDDDDDRMSNADIDEFEQKIKFNRSMMGFNDDDSDDDTVPSKSKSKQNKIVYQPPKQTKSLLNDEPDLLRQVQEMHKNKNKEMPKNPKMTDLQNEITKHKQEAKPKTEDDKLMEILNSNNTTLKDKKLKELIQKNKELYVSLEKEKTMRQKLQKDLDKVKEDTDMALAAMEGRVVKGAIKQDDSVDWKKKYTELEKKLQEVKLQNTTMKNDLNKAMRVISKEIGENVNIDQILTQENSWKGRAQQIEVLKARVKELQAKVSSSTAFSDVSSIIDKSQSEIGIARSSSIGGKSKDRREEMDALKAQVDALKTENDSLNEKIKALSSRKSILEKEIKETKNDSDRSKAILMEKSSNDDKYIAALKRELDKIKTQSPNLQTRIVYRDRPVESKRNEAEDVDESMVKKELSILKNELEKKEKIIKELINEKVRTVNTNLNKENIIQENITDQEKIIKLETMIKILRQENEELSNLKLGIKQTTPDSKIIKDLSLQNAQLRRKLDDLQQKLKPSQ